MPDVLDHYAQYYADRLWALLPEVYRAGDSAAVDQAGPLRELVNRLGAQAGVLRRSIDRLWEDQSIESCDDWIIPYVADLLATNLVASLDARGQRVDVAKTIYYRRRKGTVALLEELASDITGWEARVVELFRRMVRTRHQIDPPIGLPAGPIRPDELQAAQGLIGRYTQTSAGGWADIRNEYGASRAHTAFDELHHLPDFRRGTGMTGWHNIPRLGVFLWRLYSIATDQTTPVAVAGRPRQFSFDPTGREIPLFAADSRLQSRAFGDRWLPPEEWQMPGRIDCALYRAHRERLYPPDDGTVRSIGVYTGGMAGYTLVNAEDVEVFAEVGRFRVVNTLLNGPFFGVYCHGFPSLIGAGAYDRRLFTPSVREVLPEETPLSGGGVVAPLPSGTTTIADSLTYAPGNMTGVVEAVIRADNERRPVLRMSGPGTEWVLEGTSGATLTIEGLLISSGDIILRGLFESVTFRASTLDPGCSGASPDLFETAVDARPLIPTRLWIEGQVGTLTVDRCVLGAIRARNGGTLQEVSVSDSILQSIRSSQPDLLESPDILDPSRLALRLKHHRDPLSEFLYGSFTGALQGVLDAWPENTPPPQALADDIVAALNAAIGGASIYDPARFENVHLSAEIIALRDSNPGGGELLRLNRLLLEEAFPLELGDAAIALDDGFVHLERTTVLGRMHTRYLDASESILGDLAFVEDVQRGCVRFSACSTGSIIPRRYESVRITPGAPLYGSRRFGDPEYGQLLQTADRFVLDPVGGSIREGAQNGSEMGAYALEKNAIKERSLLIKFEEYMPLRLTPVVIYVS